MRFTAAVRHAKHMFIRSTIFKNQDMEILAYTILGFPCELASFLRDTWFLCIIT